MSKNDISKFIQTLWDIVSDSGSDHIIGWSSHGTSFFIYDTQQFINFIVPLHFNHTHLSSFIRQLNMYNFHKRKTEKSGLQFEHKLFRRTSKQLLVGIKRKPSQADILKGDELLKNYLKNIDLNTQKNSTISTDQPKQSTNRLLPSPTIKNEGKKERHDCKLVRNIILIEPTH